MKLSLATALGCALLVAAACVPPPAPSAERDADAQADAGASKPGSEPAPDPAEPARDRVARYGVESGVIHYAVEGPNVGTEVLYFVDYGDREARHATLRSADAPAGPPSVDRLAILDGTRQHAIDLKTRTPAEASA